MSREIIRTSIKVILLVLVLNFEYAVGMPFVYTLLLFSWLRRARGEKRVILLIILSVLLGIVYDISLAVSLLILSLASFLYIFGEKIIIGKLLRLFTSSSIVMILLVIIYRFSWGWNVVFQLVIELFILWVFHKFLRRKRYE